MTELDNITPLPLTQSPAAEVKALDPLTFAIRGRQLIEASAGTGKTFTIATLYLRMILGCGGTPTDRQLTPKDILVVTFTEAATQELRDRIRKRLMSAKQSALVLLAALNNESLGSLEEIPLEGIDPVVAMLWQQALATHVNEPARLGLVVKRWAKRLEHSANQMDEAEIFTIHGFCQRMLKRHAFESGSLFECELAPDTESLKHHAVFDFWRKRFYQADPNLVDDMLAAWPNPYGLLKAINAMWNSADAKIEPPVASLNLAEELGKLEAQTSDFKQAWRNNSDDLLALIQNSGADKRTYSKRYLPADLNKIAQWCESDDEGFNGDIAKTLEKYTQTRLVEKTKKGEPPLHSLFEQIETLLAAQVPVKAILLGQAIAEVRQRFDAQKQQAQIMSFDDLLGNLDDALSGPYQAQLSEAIRGQFPVALIDEFQDTDEKQFRIFSSIYPLGRDDSALVMIGDPKQAIYGFRGADIFTYIQAKRSADQIWTLGTNWRSTTSMIGAVNSLFEYSPAPFIYQQDIPFLPVQSAGFADKSPLTSANNSADTSEPEASLVFWHPAAQDESADGLMSSGEYLDVFAEATAAEIERLLNQQSHLGDTPLQAGDMAVLVRSRGEAAKVRDALLARGLASVYLSNRDSVFASQEAEDLARILVAVLQPHNERLLKAALASPIFALSYRDIDQLNQDERQWELLVAEFEGYNQVWRGQGVLPMLRRLMHQRKVATRLMQEPAGERRLTDYMHLGELLQTASAELESQTALIRWLAKSIANANGDLSEQQLRLESEQNLVQIVTIHKSKGLEYPVVFLPFIAKPPREPNPLYHNSDDELVWHLEADDEVKALATKEQLAEELRLLYVALTRPVHRCYLGVADVKVGNSKALKFTTSALGYLFASQAEPELLEQEISALTWLKGFVSSCNNDASEQPLAVLAPLPQWANNEATSGLPTPTAHAETISNPTKPQPEGGAWQVRSLAQKIERRWRVTSYSGLTYHHSHQHDGTATASQGALETLPDSLAGAGAMDMDAANDQGVSVDAASPMNELDEAVPSIFTFAKGAHAGTFLHSLFEEVSFPRVHGPELPDTVAEACELAGFSVEPWAEVLTDLVRQVVAQPLVPNQWSLANIEDADRWVEMEFTLPIEHLNAKRLDALCRSHDELSAQASPVEFEQVSGMLKGFIDLLVRIDGKYYVIDYKSNHLGMQPQDYTQEAMANAMIDHRYDLQYQIYSLALHRLLSLRLPNYDYEQHFGGVYYLFLRGMTRTQLEPISPELAEANGEQPSNGIFYTRPSKAFITGLDNLFKGESVTVVPEEPSQAPQESQAPKQAQAPQPSEATPAPEPQGTLDLFGDLEMPSVDKGERS
ncbi:MAG: exodeoxyribonuclease V subunit beta [Pontibacterium sp.]